MRRYRDLKIASLIEKELGKILARDFFIEGALLTIINVVVNPDLLRARVKIAIIPYEKGPEGFIRLQAERKNFQRQLIRKLKIRPIPEIVFEFDETHKAGKGQVAKR